jgi:hypothetical protein
MLLAVYAFLPGDAHGIIPGWPWRDVGGVVLVALIFAAGATWVAPAPRKESALFAVLIAAIVLRVGLHAFVVPAGWAATYKVEESGRYHVAERIAPRLPDKRVIDPAIALSSTTPALQFLNDGVQKGGADAARAAGLDLQWSGHLLLPSAMSVTVAANGEGVASVALDGQPLTSNGGSAQVSAGAHEVIVTLTKPSGVNAAFATEVRDPSGQIPVYARQTMEQELRNDRRARLGQRGLDLVVAGLGIVWSLMHVGILIGDARRQRWRAIAEQKWVLIAIPLLIFSIQGLVVAHSHHGLTIYSVGDDMRLYASEGRDIALHGLLANGGKPLFQGEPFYFYPFYPYFVSLSHLVFDESFYGLILLQFILLGATMAAIACLALDLFGVGAAWGSVVVLLGLGQLDFVRYYTIAVFTDNLYYPLVAFSALALNSLERKPSTTTAVMSGVFGGLATITRPSMFFVLPLVLAWTLRPGSSMSPATKRAVIKMGGVFASVIALVTLRNWLVSGRIVLIAESSLQVLYFLAPPGVEWRDYLVVRVPSIAQTIQGAVRMFLDHPLGVVMVELRKLGFMVGFTNLGVGYRLHPEFVLLSASYLGCWLTRKRAMPGTLVHLTIVAHVIAFLVASPMTYGYKTMLTLMILAVPFSLDFVVEWCGRVIRRPRLMLDHAE